MARLPDPVAGPMSPEQRALYQELTAKRGRIDGMYRSLLHHPDLLRRVADLGTFFRFGPSLLPGDLRELAILRVARRLGVAYEWVKHVGTAEKAGLTPEEIEELRRGSVPDGLSPLRRAVVEAADAVVESRDLPEAVQETLQAALGTQALLEIVVLCGFYHMIAGVIFAFDVPLPEGEDDPFETGA